MRKKHLAAVLFLLCALPLPAFDPWPEAADRNAVFVGVHFAAVSLAGDFSMPPPAFHADWVLPFPLPLSLGAFFAAPDPNLRSFGARVAYHVDVRDGRTDLFLLYVLDLGFLRNGLLLEYGDEPAPLNLYDFRLGVRRRLGAFFCLSLETGFHLQGINIGLSLKLN